MKAEPVLSPCMENEAEALPDPHADLEAAAQRLITDFMVESANILARLTVEDRRLAVETIGTFVQTLDSHDPALVPRLVIAHATQKLLVTFDAAPERAPVVVDIPEN